MDKPSKVRIKQAIDKLPAGDVKKLHGLINDYRLRIGDLRVLVRFVPEDKPLPDEVEAIARANQSIAENGTVTYDTIDWD